MRIDIGFERLDELSCVSLRNVLGTSADLEVFEGLLRIPAFECGMPWLVDNRDQREIPTLTEVDRWVSFLRDHSRAVGASRIAIVVSAPAAFAMGRVCEVLAMDMPFQIRTFWDVTEARQWLADNPLRYGGLMAPDLAVSA